METTTQGNGGTLIRSEIRYRRLFESAQDGILILDAESRKITDANPFIAELLGYSHEELLGKELWQIGLLEDRASSQAAFQRLQQDKFIRYENLPLKTRNGSVREVEFVSNVYEEDGATVIQCNIRDVAERKALQEAKVFLAAIVESSEDSIITLNPDGIITTWNHAAEKIYGYPAAQAIGQPLSILAIPGAADLHGRFDRIMRGEPVARFELARERQDGTRIFLSVQLSPVKDVSGRIIAIATTSRDLTERKRAEEELQQARGELAQHAANLEKLVQERTGRLEDKTKQLESFCYTVAHDLRAPLRSINGYAQFIRLDHDDVLSPEAREHLHRIEASAKRLDLLIQDLLAYTRVDQMSIDRKPVDLNATVDIACKQLSESIDGAAARVEVKRPLPIVAGDEGTLQHVFLNLISNALKFTPSGVSPTVTIYAEEKGDCVRIWVEDNGIGVPTQYREKIFGTFERLHEALAYPGTGIGLAIVSKAMERLGGSRGVEPNPTGGSRFWIQLPRASTS